MDALPSWSDTARHCLLLSLIVTFIRREAKISSSPTAQTPTKHITIVGCATLPSSPPTRRLLKEHSEHPYSSKPRPVYAITQAKSAYHFVPGVMGIILTLICTMMTAIAVVREREMGTMEVLLASPMRPLYIILRGYFPTTPSRWWISSASCSSRPLSSTSLSRSLFLLFGVSMLYILLALSLGLMISTLVGVRLPPCSPRGWR